MSDSPLDNRIEITPPDLSTQPPDRGHLLKHETRVMLLSLLGGLPAVGLVMYLIWWGDYTAKVQWTVSVVLLAAWIGCAVMLRERVVFPLQTVSNMLAALREGDYSIRIRPGRYDDAVGAAAIEVNVLGSTLKRQRLDMVDATNLLRAVMAEIDVAVFAFDQENRLRLVNRAGERLLAQPQDRILGRSAAQLGLAKALSGKAVRTLNKTFPGGIGRWGMRRSSFREGGLPHTLIVMTDLSQALREEERQAWQRLVRVLGHELNNSLTPIKSMAGSLSTLLALEPLPEDWQDDTKRGLSVISTRADSLIRFMSSYSRLARLPQPELAPMDMATLAQRVAGLETRAEVRVLEGPDLTMEADAAQLEQVLINLIKNAAEAAEGQGKVEVGWKIAGAVLELFVRDEGPGLSDTANLFVPFYTTKKGGSGIGLVLSRQIAEAHGGALTLENRRDRTGCIARLRLPLPEEDDD
ncbi:MAG TPA: ATP-binding protein [Acidobacteriota bacterium]|nr:ATP-binding protein [Acidobacteriota bacterium]